jgi:hypothetical protein
VTLHLLALLTLALSAADHWTTYLCLRSPVAGWDVTEANPIADWLFQAMGLVSGLMLDSVVTVIAVLLLLTTSKIPQFAKAGLFTLVVLTTSYAVFNNLEAISVLGLSPLGLS